MKLSVLLVHQGVPLDFLESFSRTHPGRYVLVTTHEFFPSELGRLSGFASPPFAIIRDRDLIEEEDFDRIDEAVSSEFVASGRPFAHAHEINEAILVHRAAIVKERLESRFGTDELEFFHADGLGINAAWWRASGSTPLCEPETVQPTPRSVIRSIRQRFEGSKRWSQVIPKSGNRIVLGGRLTRIASRLPRDAEIKTASILQRLRYAFPIPFSKIAGRTVFAAPVHDYAPSLRRPTLVLQDGHLPRDYSKSLLFCYPKSDRLVPSNPFAEEWVVRSGFAPQRIVGFSDPDFALPGADRGRISNLLLAMNHAGDWTPFIHRSDTDRLVLEFIRMAEANPRLNFRIRPHPTMVHPSHEGTGSLDRIRKEIKHSALSNLEISTETLDEDLSWAGVVISEYSQVLIDAWRSGQLGIVFNPTGRRSFMKEFEELGFPCADSTGDIVRMTESAASLTLQQRDATIEYNRILSEWRLRAS